MRKIWPEIPNPIECQGPDIIKDNCLFQRNCRIFFMNAVIIVSEGGHIPLNKAENIEEFIQPTSGNPDTVLISACVPDTRPNTDFLCLFHP